MVEKKKGRESGPSQMALWVKGYPIPGILQSVRKRLISKELEETVAFKCEASVRKEQELKELEEIEGVQGAAFAGVWRG
jgi:hypothetical protein